MRIDISMMEQYRLQKIWHLSWPVIVEMLFLLMGGFLLTLMVGRFGAAAQAAVGLTVTMQVAISLVMSAAGTGAGVLVAQAVGAQKWDLVRSLAGQALLLGMVGGLILLLFGTPLALGIVFISGLKGEVAALTQEFLQISFTFIPCVVVMQVSIGVIRALGKTKLSLLVSATNNVVLVVVASYLLFNTSIGVIGAILGASAGQFTAFIFGIFLLTRSYTVGLGWKDVFPMRVGLVREILHISLPAAVEQSALQGGRIFYTLMLASLGATQLAAHNIALQVESLSFLPGTAFSIAALTLVGQNIGRGVPFQAKRYAELCNYVAVAGMSFVGVMFLLFAPYLASLFTNDPEVHRWATICIRWAAAEQPTLAMSLVLSGVLRGIKDTRWPMLLTFLGVWGVRIPLMGVLLVMGELTVERTWMATAADFGIRSLLLLWRFKKIHWEGFHQKVVALKNN